MAEEITVNIASTITFDDAQTFGGRDKKNHIVRRKE